MADEGYLISEAAAAQLAALIRAGGSAGVAPSTVRGRPTKFRDDVPRLVLGEVYGADVGPGDDEGEIKILRWMNSEGEFQTSSDATPLPFYKGHLEDASFSQGDQLWFIWRADVAKYVPLTSPPKESKLQFRNDDSDDAPDKGIMQIVGSEDDGDGNERLIVVKPGNSTVSVKLRQPPCYAINVSGEAVPEDETGTCVLATDASAFPMPLLYDEQSSADPDNPVMGQTVGPSLDANTWKVYFGEPGFEVLRYVPKNTDDDDDTNDDDLVWVRPTETQDTQFTGVSPADAESEGLEIKPHSFLRCSYSYGLDEQIPKLLHAANGSIKQGTPVFTDSFTRADFNGRRRLIVDTGTGRPVMARLMCAPGGQWSDASYANRSVGPILENWSTYTPYAGNDYGDCLFPGLPGFRVLTIYPKENLSDYFQMALVIRDWTPTHCVAQATWTPGGGSAPVGYGYYDMGFVTCRPVATPTNDSAQLYDGHSHEFPLIEFTCYFYGWAHRQPNVSANQVFEFKANLTTSYGWVSTDPSCFDDPVGTIKMWNSASTIPPGWHICDYSGGTTIDLRGAFPVGYKSGDADFGAVGSSTVAGAKTHTHTAHGTASLGGTGTTVLTNTNNHSTTSHLPPYNVVVFIQRVAP